MELKLLALVGLLITVGIPIYILLKIKKSSTSDTTKLFDDLKLSIDQKLSSQRIEINSTLQGQIKTLSDTLGQNQRISSESQSKSIDTLNTSLNDKQDLLTKNIETQMKQLQESFKTLQENNNQRLESVRDTVDRQLKSIQETNEKKLGEMQKTVDEKLQTTLENRLSESFKQVSEQLKSVYEGLGEMKKLASNVGDLKNVLSNVKNRGILGEIQLENILADILTPEQYRKQFIINPESRKDEKVDCAVKMPGEKGECVYLPIDSKFPGDTYAKLQEAYDTGNKDLIDTAWKELEKRIEQEAKSISQKYICVPHTTNFAIMFLPFEGLYAEVARHNIIEKIQTAYHVTIAGPSTMAAMLFSLQMGFRTLQIQKASNDVWKILGAVKTEFDTFGKALDAAKKKIDQAGNDIDALVGTRTRAIQRKLRTVETLSIPESQMLLNTPDITDETEEDK
ncbi:MAG: DNA recombination protein RmuC [Marinilabiliaceae bacterium]|nr:DNA recombination protein RmuC [Marinilabiliaceae bacterium]